MTAIDRQHRPERGAGPTAPPPGADLDPNDPVLFPVLDDAHAALVVGRGRERAYAAGEPVFDQGQRDAPFLLLLEGRLDFYDQQPDGEQYVASVHPGTFAGDLAIFTGEPTVASCVAAVASRAVVLSREELRRLLAEQPGLGDVVLTTMTARRDWLEVHGFGEIHLYGRRSSADAFRVRELLGRNLIPYRWHDLGADAAAARTVATLTGARPVGHVLLDSTGHVEEPTAQTVAERYGLRRDVDGSSHDVVVVGAGPAGLAAAVYGASEGLRTLVLDAVAPGGQAGTSSRIENYLGFPTGLSGAELTRRAVLQARRFGAVLSSCHEVTEIRRSGRGGFDVALGDGQVAHARSVVLATGATYRRLDAPGAEELEGAGVYYTASHTEAVQCAGEEAVVVGGGNSAGQAALHLAGYARHVHVVIRRADLRETMSAYLVERVEAHPAITVHTRTRVTRLDGEEGLRQVTLTTDGVDRTITTAAVFAMIGAQARSEAVRDLVRRDHNGFVLTGPAAGASTTGRQPGILETSEPGVLAAGDIRGASTKRVATAVGDGALAIRLVLDTLAAEDLRA